MVTPPERQHPAFFQVCPAICRSGSSVGTAWASAAPRAALGVGPTIHAPGRRQHRWRPAWSWAPGPPPTGVPAAGGHPLTSSETLNLRSRATTFCLKFCCCKTSGARSECTGLLLSDGGAAQTAETRDLQPPALQQRQAFSKRETTLVPRLGNGPQTGWRSGAKRGDGRESTALPEASMREAPPCLHGPRGGQGPSAPSAAVASELSPGSLHRSWASGPGPEAHTDAVPALLDALRSRQLAHSVFRNQPVASGPGRGWWALGQGVSSEASRAALYAGLAWGCGPVHRAAGHRGGSSAWISLLEEGPAALPSPGPACPEQTGAGLTLGVSGPSGRRPAGLCSGTGLARCLRAYGPQPGVGPLIPWGPSSQGEAVA